MMQTLRDLWVSLDRWGRYLLLVLGAALLALVLILGGGPYLLRLLGVM
jgi:hypothetical protein